jgi:hypothetical protein
LHRQVGGFLALEDAIDITRRTPKLVGVIGPIGDQAAGDDDVSVRIDRGQLVAIRQSDESDHDTKAPTDSP